MANLTGSEDGNLLIGGTGDDTIRGFGGADQLVGGGGGDSLDGGDGDDDIDAGPGNDTLTGGAGRDILFGESGDDSLDGGEDADSLSGGAGSDILHGGGGDDFLQSDDDGDDQLYGDGGDDVIDVLRTGTAASSVFISGGDGNDDVTVQARELSQIVIDAGAGDDHLRFTELYSQAQISLGAGRDTIDMSGFDFDAARGGRLIISDFQTGPTGDVILLERLVATANVSGFDPSENPFLSGHMRLAQAGSDAVLSMWTGGRNASGVPIFTDLAIFRNVSAADFTAENLGGYSIAAGAAPVTVTGTEAGEVLTAGGGGGSVDGLDGDDRIFGGVGDDTLRGGAGSDEIESGSGDDLIEGGEGDDFLRSGHGDDQIYGGAGNDVIVDVFSGSDRLDGGGGDDRLTLSREAGTAATMLTALGGEGNDTLAITLRDSSAIIADGGAGDDRVVFNALNAAATLTLGLGRDQIDFTADITRGAGAAIVITDFAAGAAGDRVELLTFFTRALSAWSPSSNPFLTGHARLVQSGSDVLLQVDKNGGGDAFVTFLTFSNSDASAFTAFNLGGFSPGGSIASAMVLTGTPEADVLWGDEAGDTIEGLDGDDRLVGWGGGDELLGGEGNDLLEGGAGDDTLDGGAGSDRFVSGSGNDAILGGLGDDIIDESGSGNDTLRGGDGNDRITISRSSSANTDRIIVSGDLGDDLIIVGFGSSLSLDIDAGGGADRVRIGDVGIANIALGAGRDVLEFTSAGGIVTVTDFETGDGGDVVDFDHWLATTHTTLNAAANPFMTGHMRLVQSGSDVLVQWDEDSWGAVGVDAEFVNLLTLQNVDIWTLTAANLDGYDLAVDRGTAADDFFQGSQGQDLFDGAGGNDSFRLGFGGNDRAIGGAGDDRIFVALGVYGEPFYHRLDGGTGTDLLVIQGQFSPHFVTIANSGAEGSTADIEAAGIESIALLSGYDGSEGWSSSGGVDYYLTLQDEVAAAGTLFTVDASRLAADETLNFSTTERDARLHVIGGAGEDRLRAGGAGSLLEGGGAIDHLTGGAGDDILRGGEGDDHLEADYGDAGAGDLLDGVAGNDFFEIFANSSFVWSGLTVLGGDGIDHAEININSAAAGAGLAAFDMGLGNDWVEFGATLGSVEVTLGAGADRITFGNLGTALRAGTITSVTDFTPGTDTVSWSTSFLQNYAAGSNPFGTGHARLVQEGSDTLLQIDRSGSSGFVTLLRFEGLAPSDFASSGIAGWALAAVNGTPGADSLLGTTLGDMIYGLEGDDFISLAQGGDDLVRGGSGNDSFYFGGALTGADAIDGGEGSDRVLVHSGSIRPGASGLIGVETLVLLSNSNTTYGTPAAGSIGFGVTTIDANVASGASLTVDASGLLAGEAVNFNGSAETNGSFVLIGGAAADTLRGGAGADTLDGRGGVDQMIGGLGNDIYVVDAQADTVTELLNQGTDEVRTSLSAYVLGANVERLTGTSDAGQTLRGNAHFNVITGGAGNDLILAQDGGADRAVAGAGNDIVYFGTSYSASTMADGGAGWDVVAIQTRESLTPLQATSLVNVEEFLLLSHSDNRFGGVTAAPLSYYVTTVDGTVAAGSRLVVNGSGLQAGESFSFLGTNETDGSFFVRGGRGADSLTGGLQGDSFFFDEGRFGVSDRVHGMDGHDTLLLRGSYTLTFGASSLASIETLELISGADTRFGTGADRFDYAIITLNENVATRLSVDATALTGGEDLHFDGSAESDGSFSILAGAGNDVLRGGARGDLLSGGNGSDALYGGDGNDELRGGEGNDVLSDGLGFSGALYGDAGDDTLEIVRRASDSAAFTVDGGDGDDRITLDLGNSRSHVDVSGGHGSDHIVVESLAGSAAITLGAGADSISFEKWSQNSQIGDVHVADFIEGNEGDRIDLTAGLATTMFSGWDGASDLFKSGYLRLVQKGAHVELQGNVNGSGFKGLITFKNADAKTFTAANFSGHGPGEIVMLGTDGDDTLIGGTGDDLLQGLGGNDTLDGQGGADRTEGGTGDDTHYVDDIRDVTVEGVNEGYDRVLASVSYALTAGSEIEALQAINSALADPIDLVGNEYNNFITGNAGRNAISGGGGADWIEGRGGDDVLAGNDGNDVIGGEDGADRIEGGNGSDQLFGDAGDDTLLGGNDDDYLHGGLGNDFAVAGLGNDSLVGAEGDDVMGGEAGNDQLDGGTGNDQLYGDGDNDRLSGGAGADYLHGGLGDDFILGGSENDTLVGADGNDVMGGEDGNDRLEGGNGGDQLFGDAGDDTLLGENDDDYLHGGLGNDFVIGGLGNDFMIGGDGTDEMIGEDGDDVMGGEDGGDRLVGGVGDDQLFGDAGDDTLFGGNGRDYLHGGFGNDYAAGGLGNDILVGADGDDTLSGEEGEDRLEGGAGNDSLSGDADNDRLIGGAGFDYLNGGLGDDFIEGGTENDTLIGADGNDVVGGEDGADRLEGGNGRDQLFGDAGDDSIFGENDDDYLHGGLGNDFVIGGFGNDTLIGSDGDDTMGGEAGDDRLEGGSGNDALFGDADNDRLLGGAGADYLHGGFGNDFIEGGTEGDTLVGFDGDDVLGGEAGEDRLEGGEGNDQLFGDGDNDRLLGGAGADYLHGGTGNDLIEGGTESDSLVGADGDDTMGGEAGDDRLEGGAGNDYLFGDGDNDRLIGGAGADYLHGGFGNDFIEGGTENDTLIGADGDDIMGGEDGADRLEGGNGLDQLYGDGGDDTLDGGAGADTLHGGAGADSFVFGGSTDALMAIDSVLDFSAVDQIVLAGAAGQPFAALATGALSGASFRTGSAAADSDDRIIYNPATGALLYDADGTGGAAAVQFGTLSTGLALSAGNFVVSGTPNSSPTITSGITASVAENSALATIVYQAAATDSDGDTFTFSLAGVDASRLSIDSVTGAVRLLQAADFETRTSYSFSVVATDSSGTAGSREVTLSVTDVTENPTGPTPVLSETGALNDSRQTAQAIDRNTLRASEDGNLLNDDLPSVRIQGNVAAGGDRDFFSITLQQSELLILDVDGTSTLDGMLRVFGPDGREIAFNDDAGTFDPGSSPHAGVGHNLDSFISFRAPSSGTYTFSIEPYPDSDGASSGAYTLNVSVAPTATRAQIDEENIQSMIEDRWETTSLTYSFPTSTADYSDYAAAFPGETLETSSGFAALNSTQQNTVRQTLLAISQFTNLSFTEVTSNRSTADMRYALTNVTDTAHAYMPGSGPGGDSWYRNEGGQYSSPARGNYAWTTFIHETGHALGLKHGHESPALSPDRDSLEFSIMTYRPYIGASTSDDGGYSNETFGFPQTFMMYDIAALQRMYGADFTFNGGNSVYSWSPTTGAFLINSATQWTPGNGTADSNRVFMTLWDGGGLDTYDLSNYSNGVTIDLRPGEWTITSQVQLANLGDGNYARGNVANALMFGSSTQSLIENAIGGSGNDVLIANQVQNDLRGGGGADIFRWASLGDLNPNLSLDRILDFQSGSDRIDLSGIDANAGTPGDQAFSFIGGNAFTGAAGQLRTQATADGHTVIQGDVNGDGLSDFSIFVVGPAPITGADFIV